jgi:hypothetical protein
MAPPPERPVGVHGELSLAETDAARKGKRQDQQSRERRMFTR